MIVRRGALTDHYVEDDRSVVMVGETVLGLSPIATAILESVPEGAGVSLEAVTERVVETFGLPEAPDSAEDLTRQQMWDLVAHGVLVATDEEVCPADATSRLQQRRTGDARVFDDSQAAVAAVRDAVRHLRSGSDRSWSAPESLDPRALVGAARQHHVVPYLAGSLDRLDLPGQARSQLEARAIAERAGASVLATDAQVALEALHAAGVRALAFKGIALALLAHGDFALRGAGDLDLLVPPDDVARAHRALVQTNWIPTSGTPQPGTSWAWRHFMRTGHEALLRSARTDIDLHWSLAPTRGTFPDFDTLWDRRVVVHPGGSPVPTLAPYDALAHSAGHAAKDGWRWLRSLVDVHTLAADRSTWLAADRPLRKDQLLSVGIAARLLGVPMDAPPVVEIAAHQVSDATLERVLRAQDRTTREHRPPSMPGVNFRHRLVTLRLTSGSAADASRMLSQSLLPPWLTADETSRTAWVAVPRVLARRTQEVVGKTFRSPRPTR